MDQGVLDEESNYVKVLHLASESIVRLLDSWSVVDPFVNTEIQIATIAPNGGQIKEEDFSFLRYFRGLHLTTTSSTLILIRLLCRPHRLLADLGRNIFIENNWQLFAPIIYCNIL